MNKVFSMLRIAWIESINNVRSIKGCTIFLTLFFFIKQELNSLVSFADWHGCTIGFAILPYLHLRIIYTLIFAISILYYYSSVPFLSNNANYQLLRVGRRCWVFIKLMNIFFGAILLMCIETFLSIIACLPRVSFNGNWGAFWNTLSITKASEINFPRNIVVLYSPFSAQMRVFLVGVAIVTLMGFLEFAITLLLEKKYAIIICGVLGCGPVLAANSEYANIYYISPVSWIGIVEHSLTYRYTGPSISYMWCVLILLLVLLIVITKCKVEQMDL